MLAVAGRFRANADVLRHVRRLTASALASPFESPIASNISYERPNDPPVRSRASFREPNDDIRFGVRRNGALFSGLPDRASLVALLPFARVNDIEQIGRVSLGPVALEILTNHQKLQDSDILRLTEPYTSHRTLLKFTKMIIGKPHDRHKYDESLVMRLARLALSTGPPERAIVARYLICPVRDCEAPPEPPAQKLLVPDDAEAREYFNQMSSMTVTIASICWAKRLHYQMDAFPHRRQAMAEEYRHRLEAAYNDTEAGAKYRAWAAYTLGVTYVHGDILGFDGELARQWWERAAALENGGYSSQKAAYHLGCVYFGRELFIPLGGPGPLFPPDAEKGVQYFDKAHMRFNLAAYELGKRFYKDPQIFGRSVKDHVHAYGVLPNDDLAAGYYFQAARMGHLQSKRKFVEMLIRGHAHPHDPTFPKDDQKPKSTALGDPMEDEDEDEVSGRNKDNKDATTHPFVFRPRARLQTLLYARSMLKDLVDSKTNKLSRALVPEDSIVWKLPGLIEEEERQSFERSQGLTDPPRRSAYTRDEARRASFAVEQAPQLTAPITIPIPESTYEVAAPRHKRTTPSN